MAESKSVNVTFGGLSTLLSVLFIGLKLTGFIKWSWVWVLAPLWIPWAAVGIILLTIFIIGIIVALLN